MLRKDPLTLPWRGLVFAASLGLAQFVVTNRTSWTVLFAGSVIATLPMIVVFLIFQRRFIQGIAVSGLKG